LTQAMGSTAGYGTEVLGQGLHTPVVAGAVSPVSECESYRNNQTEARRELLTEGTDECRYLVG
jgi:hypothetical protein